MTTFLLVRHGMCDPVGVSLAGWTPGVKLNARGEEEVRRLADALEDLEPMPVVASPLERAQQTAAAIADRWKVQVETDDSFGEFHFGDWTGREVAGLAGDAEWRRFNVHRGVAAAPGGESMLELQARALRGIERLRERYPGGSVCAVTHAEVIRAIIATALGLPLDPSLRLEIDTASVSTVEVAEDAISVGLVNWSPQKPS
jgi:broad specificity phosphatase PhoE